MLLLWYWFYTTAFVINHDVASNFAFTKKLFSGKIPYTDFFDQNPPFVWYAGIIPLLLSKIGLWTEVESLMTSGILLTVASSLIVTLLMSRCLGTFRASLLGLSMLFALLIISGYEFLQREYISICLITPFILTLPSNNSSRLQCYVLGLIAGYGFAMKPYFVIIIGLLILYQYRLYRSWNHTMLGGLYVAFTTFIVLWVLVFCLYPAYWGMLTLASKTYISSIGIIDMLRAAKIYLALTVGYLVCMFIIKPNKVNSYSRVLFVASIGFAFIAIIQGKGFFYHFLPSVVFVFLGVVLMPFQLTEHFAQAERVSVQRSRVSALLIVSICFMFGYRFYISSESYLQNTLIPLRKYGTTMEKWSIPKSKSQPRLSLYNLSTYIDPASALCLYYGYESVASYQCLWFLGGFQSLRMNKKVTNVFALSDSLEAKMYQHIIHDVMRTNPTYILTHSSPHHQMFFKENAVVPLSFYCNDRRFKKYIESQYDTVFVKNDVLVLGRK